MIYKQILILPHCAFLATFYIHGRDAFLKNDCSKPIVFMQRPMSYKSGRDAIAN